MIFHLIFPPDEGFPVRLVGGPTSKSGRVELYFRGQWGTVCDTGWDASDTSVVCRQLGLDGPSIAVFGAFFGQGEGPNYLTKMSCFGNESRLIDCLRKDSVPLGSRYCGHRIDVGVICQSGEKLSQDSCIA